MAWRVIDANDEVWFVMAAAERHYDESQWQLTLRFRCKDDDRNRGAFWVQFPLESGSKSSLFALADRISDDELRQLLTEHQS
jgi:hypothetical protein